MDEPNVMEGGDAPEILLRDLETGARKPDFQLYRSAQRTLAPADLELSIPGARGAGPAHGSGRLLALPVLIGAALAALAGAFPGPAAGLIPLAMDVLAVAGPVLAAILALSAALIVLTRGAPNAGRAPAAMQSLRRRIIFAGTGPVTVEIGENGLQLRYPNQVWRAQWRSFDAAGTLSSELNARGRQDGALPVISESQADGAKLADLFSVNLGKPAIDDLIAEAAHWASKNSALRLALKSDPQFATQTGPKGSKALLKAGEQSEFLRIDQRFFEAPNESDLTWARFVAACIFMVQLNDPKWVEALERDVGDAGDGG